LLLFRHPVQKHSALVDSGAMIKIFSVFLGCFEPILVDLLYRGPVGGLRRPVVAVWGAHSGYNSG